MKREHVPFMVSRLIDGRPVRWVPPRDLVGDYDGRERTLEVFNADAEDQRRLLGTINTQKEVIESAAAGPIVIIFHSVKQSQQRHAEFLSFFPRPIHTDLIRPLAEKHYVDEPIDGANPARPHRRVAA